MYITSDQKAISYFLIVYIRVLALLGIVQSCLLYYVAFERLILLLEFLVLCWIYTSNNKVGCQLLFVVFSLNFVKFPSRGMS